MSQAVHPKGPLGAPTAAAFSRPEAVPQKDQAQPQPVPTPQPFPEPEEEEVDDELEPDENQEDEQEPESEPDKTEAFSTELLLQSSRFDAEQAQLKVTWVPRNPWKHLLYSLHVNGNLKYKDLVEYAITLGRVLNTLGNQRAVRVLVANSAGGSVKSTTTAYLATTFGHWLGTRVAVVDNNPNYDPIARLLGLERMPTLTVRDLAKQAPYLKEARQLQELMAWTPYSVGLIASDQGDRTQRPYDYGRSIRVINSCFNKVGHTFINSGNAVNDEVIIAGLHSADVVIVPTIPTDNRIGGAKDVLVNLKKEDPNKMERAIFLVSATERGHHVEEYRKDLGLDKEHILLGSPFDQRLKHDAPVDLTQTKLLTIIAYLELAVTVMRVATHVDLVPESTPLAIKPGHVVALPSGKIPSLPWAPKKSH